MEQQLPNQQAGQPPVYQPQQQPQYQQQQPVQPIQDPGQTPPPPAIEPINPPAGNARSSATTCLMIFGCLAFIILIAVVVGIVLLVGNQTDNGQDTQETTTQTTTVAQTGSEIVELDESWSSYTNYDYGFKINIPNQFLHGNGGCEWNEDDGDNSYRPVNTLVPVEVFESNPDNEIFITSEFFYQLKGETIVDDTSYYSGCDKVENSLAELNDDDNWEQMYWKLKVYTDVTGDEDLEDLIDERFGAGCDLGNKTDLDDSPGQAVGLSGDFSEDPMSEDPTMCNINYVFELFYYDEADIVVAYDRGQACAFYYEDVSGEIACYDEDMTESFEFLDVASEE